MKNKRNFTGPPGFLLDLFIKICQITHLKRQTQTTLIQKLHYQAYPTSQSRKNLTHRKKLLTILNVHISSKTLLKSWFSMLWGQHTFSIVWPGRFHGSEDLQTPLTIKANKLAFSHYFLPFLKFWAKSDDFFSRYVPKTSFWAVLGPKFGPRHFFFENRASSL